MIPTRQKMALFPERLNAFPGLCAAQSTRHGGVSSRPFHSLNLGSYTNDDPRAVATNQERWLRFLGWSPEQLASSRQVHGHKVLRATRPGHWEGYDALITDQPGILLAVTVADCVPVLVYDPIQRALAAVHAGWRGTVSEVVLATLQKMGSAFGTRPADCHAWVGVCIGARDYEVDADVADRFPAGFRQWDTERKKYLLDLKGANRDQLLRAGLPGEQIELSPLSTAAHADQFFSYRASAGQTGRMWAVIGRKD